MKKEVEKIENKSVEVAKKPSTANRVVSIILVVITSIILVGITLCTFVQKNFNFGINAPARVVVYTSDVAVSGTTYYNDNDHGTANRAVYDKIIKLYNDSFGSSILVALFQGKAFSGITVTEGYKDLSDSTISSGTYIEFDYTTAQKFKVNGKDYDVDIVSDTDYIAVVIQVSDSTSLAETNAYFKYKATGTNQYSYVRLSSYSAQSGLYD